MPRPHAELHGHVLCETLYMETFQWLQLMAAGGCKVILPRKMVFTQEENLAACRRRTAGTWTLGGIAIDQVSV
jgi:hypothetical protein